MLDRLESRYPLARRVLPALSVGFAAEAFAYFSQSYNLHQTELLSSYGADFIGPLFSLYSIPKPVSLLSSKLSWLGKPKFALSLYTAYAIGFETIQFAAEYKSGSKGEHLRFDPLDFLALGLGLVFALRVDRFITDKYLAPRIAQPQLKG